MVQSPAQAGQPALLFLPDISGFTQFVNATAIEHSRHIVEELIECILDANTLGLQLSEIEGDAVLFYRPGDAPDARQFFAQVERMFLSFHAQLLRYERQRLCRCGACSSAAGLTLKFVAHYGAVAQTQVRDRVKLHGRDVIVAHRLLKNQVAGREYALVTRELAAAWPADAAPRWAPAEPGVESYDVGRIEYRCFALTPLREEVPEPRSEDFAPPGKRFRAFALERRIAAPMERVFDVAVDLAQRKHWIEGVRRVELPDPGINRLGTRHRCVVDATSPAVITGGIVHAEDSVRFSETDLRGMGSAVFGFEREAAELTRVSIEFMVRDRLAVRWLFVLLLRRRLQTLFSRSLDNLARYCEARHGA